GALDLEDGDVLRGDGPDHHGRVALAGADLDDRDGGGPVDDVIVGEHLALGAEDHARPGPGDPGAELRVDVDDAGLHLGRHGVDVDVGGAARGGAAEGPQAPAALARPGQRLGSGSGAQRGPGQVDVEPADGRPGGGDQ